MPQYAYVALDSNNKKKTGTVSADDPVQLYHVLQERSLFCVSYSDQGAANVGSHHTSNKQLSLFCRQLASMLHAGMSIGDSLNVMRRRATDATMKRQAAALYEKLQKGITFSQALREADYDFPPLMISMVASGEVSGQLDSVMSDLYEHFTHENKLNNQVINAMTYPIILLAVTVLVVTFLMTAVLPTFFTLFGEGAQLPWSTRLLMWQSNSLVHFWYLYIIGVVLIVLLFKFLNHNNGYVMWRDRMKVRWPLFGKLNRTIYTARFARTFASLFRSGIPVIDAMQICADVLHNRYYDACFAQGIELIRSGSPISTAVEKMGCFDDLLVSMIYTGEQSGELDGVLKSVGEYYDQEAEAATERMVAALQPIMIIIMGLIIGFIMVSVIVPIYNMYSSIL